jgi:hypothetical protein
MVKSIINPENINYKEVKDLDDEDLGFAASLYEYSIYNLTLTLALGKEKYTYSNHGVVFFPIYLVINEEPAARIGVFELDSSKVIDSMDEDGDIDLRKGNVIIYATEKYLRKIVNSIPLYKKEVEIVDENKENTNKKQDEELVDENEPTSAVELNIPREKFLSTEKSTSAVLKDGLFKINESVKIPDLLSEETKEDVDAIKENYKESPNTPWIQKFTTNNNYRIIDNEGGGDCFFAVIRDAFEQIGHHTTVDKLRAILSKEATDELFQQYRVLYTNFLAEYQDKEKEMKAIKKMSPILKKRSEQTKDKDQHKAIIQEAKFLLDKYNRLKLEKEDAKELLDEFDYMKDITSLEKFREFLLTSSYWADTWAISSLEKLLNIKVILLSEESYKYGDHDSVLLCGQLNDEELEKQHEGIIPDYYILACYTGNHYKLISYKNKRILKFREVPYSVKAMIINKCIEKNAGPYYLLKDFRNLKNKLGIDAYEGRPNEPEDEYLNKDIYDKDIILVFHETSNNKPKAGKGSGEKIPDIRLTEFNMLNKIKDWRRKLDDSWIAPFTIDGHRWNSVEHYYLGSQYKKGFPDFFIKFSLDSASDISKDITLARAAGSKSGKLKDRVLREKNIKVDADFFEVSKNSRSQQERKQAVHAKFTQNLDLKQVLMETKRGKLVHFIRGKEGEVDDILMKLRKDMSLTE